MAGFVAGGALIAPSADAETNVARTDVAGTGHAMQRVLDGLVREDGFPAALAAVRGRDR